VWAGLYRKPVEHCPRLGGREACAGVLGGIRGGRRAAPPTTVLANHILEVNAVPLIREMKERDKPPSTSPKRQAESSDVKPAKIAQPGRDPVPHGNFKLAERLAGYQGIPSRR